MEQLSIDNPNLDPALAEFAVSFEMVALAREQLREQQTTSMLLRALHQTLHLGARADMGAEEIAIRTVKLTAVNTPVQGPGLAIPWGYRTVARFRHHTGSTTGYVGLTPGQTLQPEFRSELADNDVFGPVYISNMNKLWFAASSIPADDAWFEIISEWGGNPKSPA